jgi:hypothetical protein
MAMGRPALITPEKARQLAALCRLKPTREDCAAFLEVTPDAVDKYIKRTHGITFSEFREKNMVHTRFMIIRGLLEQCKRGNLGALIYCSKNLCGWKDNPDDIPHEGIQVIVNQNSISLAKKSTADETKKDSDETKQIDKCN